MKKKNLLKLYISVIYVTRTSKNLGLNHDDLMLHHIPYVEEYFPMETEEYNILHIK